MTHSISLRTYVVLVKDTDVHIFGPFNGTEEACRFGEGFVDLRWNVTRLDSAIEGNLLFRGKRIPAKLIKEELESAGADEAIGKLVKRLAHPA